MSDPVESDETVQWIQEMKEMDDAPELAPVHNPFLDMLEKTTPKEGE